MARPAVRPITPTNESQCSSARPTSTSTTATTSETTSPSCSCRAGGGRMITAGTVRIGSASSIPVVSSPTLPRAAPTFPGW